MNPPERNDELPLRDPRFDAAWRAASNEEPPAALDAAIRAAARREAGAGPQPVAAPDARAARRHWWPLAAAATIGAITLGLLQIVRHDELVAPAGDRGVVTDVPTTPAPTPSPPAEAHQGAAPVGANVPTSPSPPQPARKSVPAARTNVPQEATAVPSPATALPEPFPAAAPKPAPSSSVDAAKREAAAMADAQAGSAPSPAMAEAPAPTPAAPASVGKLAAALPPAAPFASGGVARGAAENERARTTAQARIATGPRADSARELRAQDRAPLPVDEWIALIRRLRAEGRIDDAARELAAFRAAHAEHERLLPADLRDWRPVGK